MGIKRITLDNLSTFLSKIKELIDKKLNKLKAGKNIKISGSTISAIDTIYDDTLVNQRITNVENSKLDNLTAGSNISIENNTISAVDTIYDDTVVVSNISALSDRCSTIEEKIPVQATSSNQLADKEFVNSSISTNTATFRGTYELIPQLTGDINDYIFVVDNDSSGNLRYNRYKNNGSEWLYEYSLNNSSFTANQWSAINSNVTSSIVAAVNSHLDNTTIHVTSLDKNKWNSAEPNVLSNWNESDITSDSYIQNKPVIPTVPTNVSAFINDAGYIDEEEDPVFMDKGASIEAVESENLDDITVIVEGRDTLTPNQLLLVEGILTERFWFGTLAEYDAIDPKIPTTIYFIEKT